MPGMLRRLVPKNGSLNRPALTWAAKTVLGTRVASQCSTWNTGAEMASPLDWVSQEERIAHPFASCRRAAGCEGRARESCKAAKQKPVPSSNREIRARTREQDAVLYGSRWAKKPRASQSAPRV